MAFDFSFTPAERTALLLRVLLCGESGHGKTFTALALAHHLGVPSDKIAAIDSETHEMADRSLRGSLEKYEGLRCECHRCRGHGITFGAFAQLKLPPDKRDPRHYVEAIRAAGRAGFELLIVDSISHEWESCLRLVDTLKKRKGGNQWAAWSDVTPMHDEFVQALMDFPGHVIACVRGKEKTEQKGREIVSRGLLPIQRKEIEFEFDVWINMHDQVAHIAKTRANRLQGRHFAQPGEELAEELLEWSKGPTAQDDRNAGEAEAITARIAERDLEPKNEPARKSEPAPKNEPAPEPRPADYVITAGDARAFADLIGRHIIPADQVGLEIAAATKAQAITAGLTDDEKRYIAKNPELFAICLGLSKARKARKATESSEIDRARSSFDRLGLSKREISAACTATSTPKRREIRNYSASELRAIMLDAETNRDRIADALLSIGDSEAVADILKQCGLAGSLRELSPEDRAVAHECAVRVGVISAPAVRLA